MLDTVERPKVIAAHLAQMDKDEIFAQVVVRMINRQVELYPCFSLYMFLIVTSSL